MMFAVITPALIAGAFAERMRFAAYVLFIALWSILVYAPVAHWVWGGGFLGPAAGRARLRRRDGGARERRRRGAGGALYLGQAARLRDRRAAPAQPDDDAARGGDPVVRVVRVQRRQRALGANGLAASAFVATHLGAAGGMLGWLVPERIAARASDDGRRRNGCGGGPGRDHARVRGTSRRCRRS